MNERHLVQLFFGLYLIGSMPVMAQEVDTEADADVAEMESVTVIGTKAERDLQDTYTSIGVLTGEEVDDLQALDFREAMQLQGNVYVAPSNNGNNGISIRGINSEGIGEPGGNPRPLMSMNIDGASQSFEGIRRGQRGTWDIRQIEVARGPQSTLQGRNSLAGTINIESNDPTPYWEGAARYTASTLDGSSPAAMISGPISDDWSFRLSGEALSEEKDIEYSVPEAEFFADDEYRNVRGKLLYEPASLPELTVKLTIADTTDKPAVTAITDNDEYDISDRFFDVFVSAAEKRENDVQSKVVDVSYELDDGYVLKSITAFIDTDALLTGTGPAGYLRDEIRSDSDITQEFRLLVEDPESEWTGVIGVFLGDFNNERDSLILGGGSVVQDLVSERDETSLALFGSARRYLGDRWQISLGARLVNDTTDNWFWNQKDDLITESDYEAKVFLPEAGIIYQIDVESSIAFNISRGYRSGFSERERTIDPEFLTNYEIAYRSTLLDDQLTFNANWFYYEWDDMQISVPLGLFGQTFTENVGEASATGAELTVYWQPDDTGLTLGSSLGLLKTSLDDYVSENGDVDFSGNEFPEAPRYSGSIWVVSRFGDNWFFSTDYVFRGSAFATSDLGNDEDRKVPSYGLVDARIGYEEDAYSIIAGVRNLFDKEYITGRDTRGGVYVGDARTYTLTLNAYF
ncbi:MAG: TonB-dependent receptor [Pseudomonadota bacterium]